MYFPCTPLEVYCTKDIQWHCFLHQKGAIAPGCPDTRLCRSSTEFKIHARDFWGADAVRTTRVIIRLYSGDRQRRETATGGERHGRNRPEKVLRSTGLFFLFIEVTTPACAQRHEMIFYFAHPASTFLCHHCEVTWSVSLSLAFVFIFISWIWTFII